jgi:hypothetical protein
VEGDWQDVVLGQILGLYLPCEIYRMHGGVEGVQMKCVWCHGVNFGDPWCPA